MTLLPQHYRVCRSPLRFADVEASVLTSCVNPLKEAGFRAIQTVLVFQRGQLYPLGAYRFADNHGRQVFVYFHRVRPYFYVTKATQRYRSIAFEYPDILAQHLAKRLKTDYIPVKPVVSSWPIRDSS